MRLEDVLFRKGEKVQYRQRFGDALRRARQSRGWTLAETARRLNLGLHGAARLNRYETGARFPDRKTLAILEKFFDIDARSAILGTEKDSARPYGETPAFGPGLAIMEPKEKRRESAKTEPVAKAEKTAKPEEKKPDLEAVYEMLTEVRDLLRQLLKTRGKK